MFLFGLLDEGEHKNWQINCISWLLTGLSILSTLFFTPISQRFTFKVASSPSAARCLNMHLLWSFFLHVLHFCCLRQLDCVHNLLLKAIQETEASFASCVDGRDCFRLRESWLVSQTESREEVPLVIKELQKQVCYLVRIFHRKRSERWPWMM